MRVGPCFHFMDQITRVGVRGDLRGSWGDAAKGFSGSVGARRTGPVWIWLAWGLAAGALPLDPPADREVRKSRFVTVADVATFVVATMPPDEPGSLDTEDYLAILAFDLKANGIDLGAEKLTLEKAQALTIPR